MEQVEDKNNQEEEELKTFAYLELYTIITLYNEDDPKHLESQTSLVISEISNLINTLQNNSNFKNTVASVTIIPSANKLRDAVSLIPSNLAYTGAAKLRQNIDLLHVRVCFVEQIMTICKEFMKSVSEFTKILKANAQTPDNIKDVMRSQLKAHIIKIFAPPLELLELPSIATDEFNNLNTRELLYYWLSSLSDLIPPSLQSPECELNPLNIRNIIAQINMI